MINILLLRYLKVDRKCQKWERATDKISTLISNVSKFKDPEAIYVKLKFVFLNSKSNLSFSMQNGGMKKQ
jgi:hypothetical protein